MVSFYNAMEYLASRINITDIVEEFATKKARLIENINSKLFNKSKNYYCDYNKKLRMFTNRLSPASFMPLFYGFAR